MNIDEVLRSSYVDFFGILKIGEFRDIGVIGAIENVGTPNVEDLFYKCLFELQLDD